MTRAVKGWKVVCPDGAVRHYSFRNLGDAQSAADASAETCSGIKRNEDGLPQAPCLGGPHLVRRTSFDDAPLQAQRARS
jgi:hypothetical protein